MSLVSFQGTTYLQRSGHWFAWESAWGTFRPIDALQWDGARFITDDRAYCGDPTNDLFGFGSEAMKEACAILTDTYESKLDGAAPVSSLCIGEGTWVRDRQVSLTPCAPTDVASWKRMCGNRTSTCKQRLVRRQCTKRNVRVNDL